MIISETTKKRICVLSWSGQIVQGSRSWYSSIGISIRRIFFGFSSQRVRGFGPRKKTISCVLVPFVLVTIWWSNKTHFNNNKRRLCEQENKKYLTNSYLHENNLINLISLDSLTRNCSANVGSCSMKLCKENLTYSGRFSFSLLSFEKKKTKIELRKITIFLLYIYCNHLHYIPIHIHRDTLGKRPSIKSIRNRFFNNYITTKIIIHNF